MPSTLFYTHLRVYCIVCIVLSSFISCIPMVSWNINKVRASFFSFFIIYSIQYKTLRIPLLWYFIIITVSFLIGYRAYCLGFSFLSWIEIILKDCCLYSHWMITHLSRFSQSLIGLPILLQENMWPDLGNI
jgi:hypothetical protein